MKNLFELFKKLKINSYQKCELLKRNFFSKEDSIINGLTVYYLKKVYFKLKNILYLKMFFFLI